MTKEQNLLVDLQEELQKILQEYREIEKKLDTLTQQKQQLRERIQFLLAELGHTRYHTRVGDEQISISLVNRINIQYDEDKLRQRLGEKYHLILEPDIQKIRKNLNKIRDVLSPYFDTIGSPSRKMVEKRVTDGELAKEDFQGAFEKTKKTIMYVRKRTITKEFDRAIPY